MDIQTTKEIEATIIQLCQWIRHASSWPTNKALEVLPHVVNGTADSAFVVALSKIAAIKQELNKKRKECIE